MKDKKRLADAQGSLIVPDLGDAGDEAYAAEAEEILAKAAIGETYEDSNRDSGKQETSECFEGKGLIKIFKAYEERFGRPRSVFYPGCGIDVSPLKGFPNSEIVFLDPDKGSARIMRAAGISILEKGIEDYDGGKHDLALLLNPYFPAELVLPYVEKNGKIMANRYLHATGDLIEAGLPILTMFSHSEDNREVIELPSGEKPLGDLLVVFGGQK